MYTKRHLYFNITKWHFYFQKYSLTFWRKKSLEENMKRANIIIMKNLIWQNYFWQNLTIQAGRYSVGKIHAVQTQGPKFDPNTKSQMWWHIHNPSAGVVDTAHASARPRPLNHSTWWVTDNAPECPSASSSMCGTHPDHSDTQTCTQTLSINVFACV